MVDEINGPKELDKSQRIVSSVRHINAVIEEMVRNIHKRDKYNVSINLSDISSKEKELLGKIPELKKDLHFSHFINEIREFEIAFQEWDTKVHEKKLDYFPELENIAAKMLVASRGIHGHKPGPFAFIGRLFR